MLMVPKEKWRKIPLRGGDGRRVRTSGSANVRYVSLKYRKGKLVVVNSGPTGHNNCLYSLDKAEEICKVLNADGISKSPAYVNMNDVVDVYKIHLKGEDFYIDVRAFESDEYGAKLNEITELPSDLIDNFASDEFSEQLLNNMLSFITYVQKYSTKIKVEDLGDKVIFSVKDSPEEEAIIEFRFEYDVDADLPVIKCADLFENKTRVIKTEEDFDIFLGEFHYALGKSNPMLADDFNLAMAYY